MHMHIHLHLCLRIALDNFILSLFHFNKGFYLKMKPILRFDITMKIKLEALSLSDLVGNILSNIHLQVYRTPYFRSQ